MFNLKGEAAGPPLIDQHLHVPVRNVPPPGTSRNASSHSWQPTVIAPLCSDTLFEALLPRLAFCSATFWEPTIIPRAAGRHHRKVATCSNQRFLFCFLAQGKPFTWVCACMRQCHWSSSMPLATLSKCQNLKRNYVLEGHGAVSFWCQFFSFVLDICLPLLLTVRASDCFFLLHFVRRANHNQCPNWFEKHVLTTFDTALFGEPKKVKASENWDIAPDACISTLRVVQESLGFWVLVQRSLLPRCTHYHREKQDAKLTPSTTDLIIPGVFPLRNWSAGGIAYRTA